MPRVDNRPQRYRELCVQQERLRFEHNEWGRRFREREITKSAWKEYLKTDFEPKSRVIEREIGDARKALISKFNFKIQSLKDVKIAYPVQIDTNEKRMHYLLVLEHTALNADMDNPLLKDIGEKMSALRRTFTDGP